MGAISHAPNVPAPLKLHRILQICILRQVKLGNPFAKSDMFEMSFQNIVGPSRVENEAHCYFIRLNPKKKGTS